MSFLRTRIGFRYFAAKEPELNPDVKKMKRMICLGCLSGILLSAACERLDLAGEVPCPEQETTVSHGEVVFSLDDVARLLASVPLGAEQVEEVRDAVSASTGNGYDEEYTMRSLFASPGEGIGGSAATRSASYATPLRDLLSAEVRRSMGTRAMDPEAFLDALSSSDVQIYWPYSEEFDTDEIPVVTFNPGGSETTSTGYLRHPDGTVEEVVVDEEMARERPVWVVNRNIDAEYRSLEMLRREDPDWGQGGGSVLVRPGTRAGAKDLRTLVLRSVKVNRQLDTWFCGGAELWVKVGAVEDFRASTEAELRLYSPSVTDFLIVVPRKKMGQTLAFNAVLVSEWTDLLENCAFMLVEDDGGSLTSWKCSATVKYNSKAYGFEVDIPVHTRDDIIWRGALTRSYIEKYSGKTGRFGDVDLTLELI